MSSDALLMNVFCYPRVLANVPRLRLRPRSRPLHPPLFTCQYIRLTNPLPWGHFSREVEIPRQRVDLLVTAS